ncbi:hypothetical protein BREU_0817 [Bifidobacterium reuteri DSM 23975]|uniref:Uncharacterized protein n=1 Tax=Bifidobacterium reuteri DSM 23975 TaxID=1437610 RepID=A0A087CXN2_9BIFI|nr:hypothetical protein BREU_0817 [Bifidobacterium reuteri DSM 23975]
MGSDRILSSYWPYRHNHSRGSSRRWFTPYDVTDYLFLLALLALPVDGTVLGFYQPFWTPISPWLFMLYALTNPVHLERAMRRYAFLMIAPVLLIYLSGIGWAVYGVHARAIIMSLTGVIAIPATVCALDIAFIAKRLSTTEAIRAVLATYWFAFAVGIAQWFAVHLDIASVQEFFGRVMYRSYLTIGSSWSKNGLRPQFLFAEPSYTGMHVFGILLPLMWLAYKRGSLYAKQLRSLIIVFVAGGLLMGVGTRIVLDSIVALLIVIVMAVRWRDRKGRRFGLLFLAVIVAITATAFAANSRLSAIVEKGMSGDDSFLGRIYQSLGPLCGIVKQPWTALTGYGAGNIDAAVHQGAQLARTILESAGAGKGAIVAAGWYRMMTSTMVWTMSAYTSFSLNSDSSVVRSPLQLSASSSHGMGIGRSLPSAGPHCSHTCISNSKDMPSRHCRCSSGASPGWTTSPSM